jgi:hypothetical protein
MITDFTAGGGIIPLLTCTGHTPVVPVDFNKGKKYKVKGGKEEDETRNRV